MATEQPTPNEVINYKYAKNTILPWFESASLEFKRSLCEAGRESYLKTLCAMLNLEGGGCILFGVQDDGIVEGFVPSRKNKTSIDHLKLMVDGMCYKQLVYRDGCSLSKNDVTVIEKKLSPTEYMVIVHCRRSRPEHKVVVANTGEEYFRGNASTLLSDKGKRWVEKPTVQSLLNQERQRVLQQAELCHSRILKQQKQYYTVLLDEVERNHVVDIDQISKVIYDAHHIQNQHKRPRHLQCMYFIFASLVIFQWIVVILMASHF